MAILTFQPARNPGLPLKKTPIFKTRSAGFGDGYEQNEPDGINSVLWQYDLVWNNIPNNEADAIMDFIVAHKGAKRFHYTPPGEIQRKFICKNPIKTWEKSSTIANVSLTLTEKV